MAIETNSNINWRDNSDSGGHPGADISISRPMNTQAVAHSRLETCVPDPIPTKIGAGMTYRLWDYRGVRVYSSFLGNSELCASYFGGCRLACYWQRTVGAGVRGTASERNWSECVTAALRIIRLKGPRLQDIAQRLVIYMAQPGSRNQGRIGTFLMH